MRPPETPESDISSVRPSETPEFDISSVQPPETPEYDFFRRPPLPALQNLPTKTVKSKIKIHTKKTTDKFEFNFTDSEIMDINIDLKPYTPGAYEPPDADDINPDELIKLVNTDNFCIKVATSLRDIYDAKLTKYKKLQEKIAQSIKNDTYEKNNMRSISDIDKQELDRLFPMIIINTAFLIKLRTLAELASTKLKEYSMPGQRNIIEKVRKNLLLSITDEEDGILSITGASRVKIRNQLCKTLYILSKGYRPFMDAFLNLVFTGPAGVGKTKLAKTYGFVFENSGILLRGDLIIASPKDMVGEYLGHTAIKSAGVLMKALEGVILIDEAYQIMPCKDGKLDKDSRSFGPEAITEIVNFLDKYMGMSIMIVSGYEESIENCFFGANEGLNRRFPNRISIPPYSNSDLLNIFVNEVNKKIGENIFDEVIIKYIFTIIVKLSKDDTANIFANQAGDMINLSSMFVNSYYGSLHSTWNERFDYNVKIVNSAFNQFLRNKGYFAVFTE